MCFIGLNEPFSCSAYCSSKFGSKFVVAIDFQVEESSTKRRSCFMANASVTWGSTGLRDWSAPASPAIEPLGRSGIQG